ncbi:MAG: peptide chain release factor 1, partial [Clostridium sp.]
KEHSSLEEIVLKYREYKDAERRIAEDKEMLQDKLDRDMKELVEEELKELVVSKQVLQEELQLLLLPKDPNDSKNVFVEIRGGAGGDEAALFASVLFRMYTRYAERQGWKTEIMSANETGIGGFKEVVFMIKGHGAYSKLKYESGVHRVQRVPETETSGRIHTSTATVAVLPEVEDVEVQINANDIKVDVFRASGNGGQCVNTTDSAVRMTHLPTGIVVSMQDEKSQIKNREKALKILKARIYEMELAKQQSEIAKDRKSQVGTGDRSERIRTFNYPQGRITDHRIGLTVYRMDAFLDGDIDEAIDGLITADQAEKLKQLG